MTIPKLKKRTRQLEAFRYLDMGSHYPDECRGAREVADISSNYPLSVYAPCNLLAENMSDAIEGNTIQTIFRPFEIKTFKLWFYK